MLVFQDQLKKSSSRFARAALSAHGDGDLETFAVDAAVAIELLTKAALSKRHPALIAASDFDSLLHACDQSAFSGRPRHLMKTITGLEGLRRAGQLLPDLRATGRDLEPLFDSRNAAIHLGDPVLASDAYVPFLRAMGVLLDDLDLDPSDFWGDFAALVEATVREHVAEAEVRLEAALVAARREFARRYAGLEESEQRVVIKSIEATYLPTQYEEETCVCPACGHEALLQGETETEWVMEEDGDASFLAHFVGYILNCRVCGLEIDGDELERAEVEVDFDIEADPADFYDPDEDRF
jgi:hypothetical protein